MTAGSEASSSQQLFDADGKPSDAIPMVLLEQLEFLRMNAESTDIAYQLEVILCFCLPLRFQCFGFIIRQPLASTMLDLCLFASMLS